MYTIHHSLSVLETFGLLSSITKDSYKVGHIVCEALR
jgi:hypothetical protein